MIFMIVQDERKKVEGRSEWNKKEETLGHGLPMRTDSYETKKKKLQ